MLFKNALDDIFDVLRFLGPVQLFETLIDGLANQVGQREPLFPEQTSFPQASFIQPHIHKARTHVVKIPRIYSTSYYVVSSAPAGRFLEKPDWINIT